MGAIQMNRSFYAVNERFSGMALMSIVLGVLLSLACFAMVSCNKPTPISIHVVYSSEKQAWLAPLVTDYNQSQSRIYVEATPMGSVDSIRSIVVGIDQPTVWSPASSVHIPMAEAEWRRVRATELVDGAPQSLVSSLVVIAIWQEMAEALGWPVKPIGWADIAELAAAEQGWAAYGRPEWGAFKFGYTHPEYSNSGLISLVAMAYAGAGKQGVLTPHDLADPQIQAFIETVGQSVVYYGSSTGSFSERMFQCGNGGMGYLSAAVLYEHLVIEQEQKRREGRGCAAEQSPVVAIYPVEGTFWVDHPYVILNAPWVTPEQKTAAREFEAFLRAAPQQQRAIQLGFRPFDAPVMIYERNADGSHRAEATTMLLAPSTDVIQQLLKLWRQS